MSKKFVFRSFVLALFLVSAMPAWAGMTVSDVNLIGQFGYFDGGGNYTGGDWPDFNGVPDNNGWSKRGTKNGLQPKAVTSNDPNQLPTYSSDPGSGSMRVFYTPVNGGSITQTFSTDGNTDGFALTRIALRISGSGSNIADENYPFTVHIFDVCDRYGYIPPDVTSVIPANARPYGGSVDFLSGPAFAADPCLMRIGSSEADILLSLDFNEYDRVDLEPNHTYAFEVWGPVGWTAAPPYIWGMVWNTLENTGPAGCGYQVTGTADNGNGPGASNLTNPRGMSLGGVDRDFVVGVYGDYADGNAYHPEPRKYQTGVSLTPTLTWHPGKWAKTHQVWFSTSFNRVAQRQPLGNKGRVTDPCYVIALDPCYPTGLALNTTYYWRVDEYNDTNTVPVPHPDVNYFWGVKANISGDTTDRATIYRFTTISPAASSPVPATGAVPQQASFKPQAAWLKWTPGALVQTTSGHKVYFGTSWGDVNHASEANGLPLYRGTTSDPCYPLKNLFPDYALTSGTAYYWRVDEVNGTTVWPGTVWNFKMPDPAFILLDNFSYSPADLAKVWQSGYKLPYGGPGDQNTNGGSISVSGGILTMTYDNSYSTFGPWSEAKLDYNSPTGVDWTLGGAFVPKALAVQFDGNMSNTLNSININNDKIYMGIQDAQGKLGVVYYSDVYAAQRAITIDSSTGSVREWKVALSDLTSPNSVDLTQINRVFVGIGSPRGAFQNVGYGGIGKLRFANLKVYVQHCNPTYPMVSAVPGDLGGPLLGPIAGDHTRYTSPDCVVNIHDIYNFFGYDWLFNEPNLSYGSAANPGTSNLTAWYMFDEGSGTTITDSSGNGRTATLNNLSPFTWSYAGHDGTGYSVNLEPGYHTWIECPNTVVANTGGQTGQSFTFWLKYDDRFAEAHKYASVLVFFKNAPGTGTGGAQTIETQLPVPYIFPGENATPWLRWVDMRISKETGLQKARASLVSSRWNHYALVYDTSVNPDPNISPSMRIYINGVPVAGLADAAITRVWGPNDTGDGNANTVRIGTRNNDINSVNPIIAATATNQFWQGKLDDMRLYSKALSKNEVQWLATDGTGNRNMQALFNEPTDFNNVNTATLPAGQTVKIINFRDYAVLAGYWLNQQLWP